MLKHRPFMKNIPFLDIDYCQFSDRGYQNPTRLWCCERITNLPKRVCDPQICPNTVQALHRERLGGYQMKFSTRAKLRTPSTLVDYLLSAFELPKAGGRMEKRQEQKTPNTTRTKTGRQSGVSRKDDTTTRQIPSKSCQVVPKRVTTSHEPRSPTKQC
jgi:hypothetical protein